MNNLRSMILPQGLHTVSISVSQSSASHFGDNARFPRMILHVFGLMEIFKKGNQIVIKSKP